MESNLDVEVLMTIPNTVLYHIDSHDQRLLNTGSLKFCQVSNSSLFIIMIGDFTYTLSSELPVMRSNYSVALPDIEGYYGVVLPFDIDLDTLQCLDELLGCQCEYRVTDHYEIQDNVVEEQLESNEDTSELNKPIEEEEEKKSTESEEPHVKATELGNWLSEAGKKAKSSMVKGAFLGALGIVQGGIYLKGKIKKKEESAGISQKTQEKLQKLKSASSKVLSVSQTAIDKAVKSTSKVAKKISNKITNNGEGNKLTNSKTYKSAQEIGRGALTGLSEVFEGLEQALTMLARATSSATVDIVTHRYGKSAKTNFSIDTAIEVQNPSVKKVTKSSKNETPEILLEENEEGVIEYEDLSKLP